MMLIILLFSSSIFQAELKAVKAAYEKAFNSTLEDDMNAKCSEDVKKLLVPVLHGKILPF